MFLNKFPLKSICQFLGTDLLKYFIQVYQKRVSAYSVPSTSAEKWPHTVKDQSWLIMLGNALTKLTQ